MACTSTAAASPKPAFWQMCPRRSSPHLLHRCSRPNREAAPLALRPTISALRASRLWKLASTAACAAGEASSSGSAGACRKRATASAASSPELKQPR
eukprot:scaffold24639_cov50-Phaeocystis_antarctica.AAC.2